MAKNYSKYSDDELMKIAGSQPDKATIDFNNQLQQNIGAGISGFLSNIPNAILNVFKSQAENEGVPAPIAELSKGVSLGGTQGLSDIGLSVTNLFRQNKIPHPDILNENPQSIYENIGQNVGKIAAPLAIPGLSAVKGAQLAPNLISKLLLGSGLGAAEGYAMNEGNRGEGAILGSLLGGGSQGASSLLNLSRNIQSKNIAKHVSNEVDRMNKHFNNRFENALLSGEEAGANEFLRGEKANIKLLKKEGNAKNVYALEKFNANPTLKGAHEAQKDLAKIERKYKNRQENKLETDIYKEALKSKNRILQKISDAFEKSGAKEHGESYQNARAEYLTEAVPYIESPAIRGLLGKNKTNAQTIRPKEFADKLLQEEEFLARAGEKHPGLLQREKTKKIIKHPLTKLGAVAAISYLPYEIQKLLGSVK
jgi:hypothetical protein